ncbi:MAG: exodeoxyribonuclease VII large subunit [Candidatus Omnitrophica bacterium]|nr:exodeoxyribonuclease VII large subunit [Candidatus Omnitrophota bacterium]
MSAEIAAITIQSAPAAAPQALTVAQVVAHIRDAVASRFPAALWIEGEVSNCTYHASGHIYFSLVDEQVTDRFGQRLVLPCAFFRGANQGLKFKITDGLKVLALGQVMLYESRGQYQLRVLRVEPKGVGALQLAFDQLKKRLSAEGLFSEERKRPLPALPNRIGIINSRSGSAVHDMVSKLRGWFDVVILACKVQGDGAADDIAACLDMANTLNVADVLIVGRGGGSVEDLWAFNEEPVARAIARSRIPVMSAVGHQDDWTIADYVADHRASTPTDAAKLLVNERQQLLERARQLAGELVGGMEQYLALQTHEVQGLTDRLDLLHPAQQLAEARRRVEQWQSQLVQGMTYALDRDEQRLGALAGRLQALSPLAVLARGYSITFRLPDRRVVTDPSAVHAGDRLETQVARGTILSAVMETTHMERA